MSRHQKQRYEYKYVIPPRLVAPMRDFLRAYLELDYYSSRQPDLAYPIHSLYLDSADLHLYQTTINGDRNRNKLRVRYYEPEGQSPLFFEIKKRSDSVIYKHRATVRREVFRELLAGRAPSWGDLHEKEEAQWLELLKFTDLLRQLDARPQTHVWYRREAWLSKDNSVRVTFDRQIGTAPNPHGLLDADLALMVPIFENQVVLEIKFTNRFPLWLNELVSAFGLRQGSAAKYVDGVLQLGEHRFLSAQGRLHERNSAMRRVRQQAVMAS